MDRTKASDAFSAGSIPVGCIYITLTTGLRLYITTTDHVQRIIRKGDSVKKTIKESLLQIRDFILARGKIVLPVLLIAAVAITVTIALKASSVKAEAAESGGVSQSDISSADVLLELEVPDVPLELNAYVDVNNLILNYYNAIAEGDADAIEAIQSSLDDLERICISELGEYIESYPAVEVYTKPGPEENSYIVIAYTKVIMSYYPEDYLPGYVSFYVCSREDGSLYINQEQVTEEISEYIRKVILQDDVVELCNKITVEYKDICIEKPELFNYISEVEQQVKAAAGTILAQQANDVSGGDAAAMDGDSAAANADGIAAGEVAGGAPAESTPQPQDAEPVYATTTTTVNVRSSDSETADKLGKAAKGSKLEVLEQKANGWSKIVYEGEEGFIKSEFLNIAQKANDVDTIGSVTALTSVNIRSGADESSEKLGILAGGEVVDLVSKDGDWCKVVYNGMIGYVKAEYVQE